MGIVEEKKWVFLKVMIFERSGQWSFSSFSWCLHPTRDLRSGQFTLTSLLILSLSLYAFLLSSRRSNLMEEEGS